MLRKCVEGGGKGAHPHWLCSALFSFNTHNLNQIAGGLLLLTRLYSAMWVGLDGKSFVPPFLLAGAMCTWLAHIQPPFSFNLFVNRNHDTPSFTYKMDWIPDAKSIPSLSILRDVTGLYKWPCMVCSKRGWGSSHTLISPHTVPTHSTRCCSWPGQTSTTTIRYCPDLNVAPYLKTS